MRRFFICVSVVLLSFTLEVQAKGAAGVTLSAFFKQMEKDIITGERILVLEKTDYKEACDALFEALFDICYKRYRRMKHSFTKEGIKSLWVNRTKEVLEILESKISLRSYALDMSGDLVIACNQLPDKYQRDIDKMALLSDDRQYDRTITLVQKIAVWLGDSCDRTKDFTIKQARLVPIAGTLFNSMYVLFEH